MSVTITPSANTALDTDLIFSGTVAISGALADNSEKFNVSVYNQKDGATFYGVPQTYNSTDTVIYNYPNGTVMTVNFSTGAWTYQRLTSEVGDTSNKYTLTFTLTGGTTTSNTLAINPVTNVVINAFSVNTLDDLDTKVTGACDISFTDVTGLKISLDINVDSVDMTDTAQSITSTTQSFTFNYSDGSKMVVDLGAKTWEYTRKTTDVGDNIANAYFFNLNVGNVKSNLYVSSFIGEPPTINKFTTQPAYDTDSKIRGVLNGDNIVGETAQIDVTHNNITMSGTTKTLTANSQVTWTYTDGSSLTVNTTTWEWEYSRVQSDYEDLRTESYTFDISITSRYGNDTATTSVETTIPTANIIAFSADGVADTEPTIEGVLNYTLPTVANDPTMQVDATINGTQYTGVPINLSTATTIEFTYSDTSKFEVDPDNGTFTFTRSRDDTEIVATDTYTFRCSIIVNGQRTEKSITVQTYSSIRNYDYQPAYPILFYAGSPEAENTAWPKYIEEIKRVYRLYNENMNYYESMTKGVFKRIDDLEKAFNGIAANLDGIILPYTGDVDKIPDGWYLCDGENGTPDLRDRFLQGSENAGSFVEAGLPEIYGAVDITSGQGAMYTSGSFAVTDTVYSVGGATYPSYAALARGGINFYASRSNAIYGRSNSVQPKSYTVCYIMKVADAE